MNDTATADKPQLAKFPAKSWEKELADATVCPPHLLKEQGYIVRQHAKAGFWLGSLVGCTSLVANVIGSTLWPAISGQAQHPLRMIQVYLTFPLGEAALALESGVVLGLGCLWRRTMPTP
jgi:hypothetical protein